MSGIYIHIPFCHKACNYCGFHFSTNTKLKDEMISSICKEINLRKDFLKEKKLRSIYFGGGTPSLLTIDEINKIINEIKIHFDLSLLEEVTIEVNPEDINENYILDLQNYTILNRMSVGVQSFVESHLKWMNRASDIKYNMKVLDKIINSKFKNSSIDLIYGYEILDNKTWEMQLETAVNIGFSHISSYSMTIEPHTFFSFENIKKDKKIIDDNVSAEQFLYSIDFLNQKGFEQYEISNFAKPNHRAIHNSNYWNGTAYLGVGPSAHSFDGINIRSWNIANNAMYIKNINQDMPYNFDEILKNENIFLEYIMTKLRLIEGIKIEEMQYKFGEKQTFDFQRKINQMNNNYFLDKNKNITLSNEGKLWIDKICVDLI